MYVVNTIPDTSDDKNIKTLKFPFQVGPEGFPAIEVATNYIFTNIVSLLMTSKYERVMNNDLGVGIYKYVFENMTPIQNAQLANEVANAIENYIPGVIVNSVYPSVVDMNGGGIGKKVIFDVSYTINGQPENQQVEYAPGDRGANETIS